MHRRNFCRLAGLAPCWAWALARHPVAAAAEPSTVPTTSPTRTIEVDPDVETAEPPVMTAVAVSPDGRLIAAAGDDHFVRLWSTADGSLTAAWREHTDWVRAVAYHPAGKRLLTAGDDHQARLWDLSNGAVLKVARNPGGVLHRALFLPDGKRWITSGFDDRVRIYDAESGEPVRELTAASDDVRALAVAPNGSSLAAAGRNGVLRIWDLADYKQIAEAPAHRMRVRVLTYSSDGGRIVSAGDDRKFFSWSAEGVRETTLANPPGRLMAAAFLDADRVAVGGSDNVIRIIDVASRRELQQLTGHTGSIAALDYFADTGLLASSSFDTTVRLWSPGGTKPANQVTRRPAGIEKK
jgi:WD40 repeat protein